jgi:Zn-dependent protease
VYLFEPAHTSWDLKFNLFGIHVRVHPMFWLVTAVLGWHDRELGIVALWIAVVFFSILIHELGHVLMGMMFGSHGHIVLYGFGGLAIGSSNLDKRWQRNLVYFAGPLAQFLLYGFVYLIHENLEENQGGRLSPMVAILFRMLFFVNLWWPILNLLPIWPLDGGRLSRETFQWIVPKNGIVVSLIVSIIVAGILAVHALAAEKGYPIIPFIGGDWYMGLLFALFAVSNIQELQILRYHTRRPWEQNEDSW